MKAIERAVPAPELEVVGHRRARRQVLGDSPPLAACAEDVHQPVHHLAHVHRALVAAPFARPDERLHMAPFLIRQIARIPQFAAVVPRTVLDRPNRRPLHDSGRYPWTQAAILGLRPLSLDSGRYPWTQA